MVSSPVSTSRISAFGAYFLTEESNVVGGHENLKRKILQKERRVPL
jgi:hypothetical protein